MQALSRLRVGSVVAGIAIGISASFTGDSHTLVWTYFVMLSAGYLQVTGHESTPHGRIMKRQHGKTWFLSSQVFQQPSPIAWGLAWCYVTTVMVAFTATEAAVALCR